jgi:hypothetical protein
MIVGSAITVDPPLPLAKSDRHRTFLIMKPVKILFLAANPTDQAPLRTDDERRKIDVEIIKSGRSALVKLFYEPGIRRDQLIEALGKHRPDIVHFAGHGSSEDAIVLLDADGNSAPLDTESVAELFRLKGKSVKLVLLNACYSKAQAEAIIRHVPCAIGMNRAIPDDTALSFATTFYQGLVQGEPIQTAFESSLFQIGGPRGPARDGGPRDLNAAAGQLPLVIPELISAPGSEPATLKLVDEEQRDESSSDTLRSPLKAPRTGAEKPRGSHRSHGLPVDRGLGNAAGVSLLFLAGAYLLFRLLIGLGIVELVAFLPWWLWIPAVLLVALGLVLLSPLPYRRSRLLEPDRLRVHKDDPAHFFGRKEDLDRLLDCCRTHFQTNLVGESGSGKSTLVRMGLLRHWDPKHVVPIDEWGQDWDEGPRRALVALHRFLNEDGEPVLVVFDQLDDYQARHRDRFLEPGGTTWKSAGDIEKASPYWHSLARLVQEGRVRVLFVTRADAAIGLDSVRFVKQPKNNQLGRLDAAYVDPLLDTLTRPEDGAEVVSDPQFGWERLKQRLSRDLQTDGFVLPIQMAVTLRALRYLPSLTSEAYARAGGVRGLEALWIERVAVEIATALNMDRRNVLGILSRLVDRQSQKTVAARTEELAQEVEAQDQPKLVQALEMLEDREIIRRTVATQFSAGETAWQLDHDFLSRGVAEAERRMNRWQTRLDEMYRAWKTAESGLSHWWGGLLDPWTQVVLLFQKLRGRLRYGATRGYAAQSLARFAPYLLAFGLVGVTGRWVLEERDAEKARGFLRSIGGPRDHGAGMAAALRPGRRVAFGAPEVPGARPERSGRRGTHRTALSARRPGGRRPGPQVPGRDPRLGDHAGAQQSQQPSSDTQNCVDPGAQSLRTPLQRTIQGIGPGMDRGGPGGGPGTRNGSPRRAHRDSTHLRGDTIQ